MDAISPWGTCESRLTLLDQHFWLWSNLLSNRTDARYWEHTLFPGRLFNRVVCIGSLSGPLLGHRRQIYTVTWIYNKNKVYKGEIYSRRKNKGRIQKKKIKNKERYIKSQREHETNVKRKREERGAVCDKEAIRIVFLVAGHPSPQLWILFVDSVRRCRRYSIIRKLEKIFSIRRTG